MDIILQTRRKPQLKSNDLCIRCPLLLFHFNAFLLPFVFQLFFLLFPFNNNNDDDDNNVTANCTHETMHSHSFHANVYSVKWPSPASFPFILGPFNETFLQQINVEMSIQYPVLGFQLMTFWTWVNNHYIRAPAHTMYLLFTPVDVSKNIWIGWNPGRGRPEPEVLRSRVLVTETLYHNYGWSHIVDVVSNWLSGTNILADRTRL